MKISGSFRALCALAAALIAIPNFNADAQIPKLTTINVLESNETAKSTMSTLFENLPACNLTSKELAEVDDNTIIDSCLLYNVLPPTIYTAEESPRISLITAIGVFPSYCDQHRDGALAAVQKINEDNNGRGAKVGYNGDHFLQFRYVAVISGNSQQMLPDEYAQTHEDLLESMIVSLQPQYIVGSCSIVAKHEKRVAGKHKMIVLSQVGPDVFYTQDSNDYVFGVHIRSETYGIPAFQALKFSTKDRTKPKIRILHRDRSQFFNSTCQEIYKHALQDGFTDTVAVSYNPEGDEDGNGINNQHEVTYLQGLADDVCPPGQTSGDDPPLAIWACVQTDLETNTILDRWKANGCRPSSLWLTTAAWAYTARFPDNVIHMQAGGQWHNAMAYSDEYFPNGQAMIDYIAEQLNYQPGYGALGTYHAIYLMYKNTASFVRTKDQPDIENVYKNQYEEIRRHLLGLSVRHSLYGPTNFDENQRNVGRGSAGMQWGIPFGATNESKSELLLVSPIDQAEATVVFPAPTAHSCPGGQFVNESAIATDSSILSSKCSACPVNTYRSAGMPAYECELCKDGSSTDGASGAEICTRVEDNLIPRGLLVFGYCIMVLSMACSTGFGIWTIIHHADPVIVIGQLEFLLLLCIGSMISSSAIIPLSMQAATEGDTTAASRACLAVPWLYSTGWITQYASICAKSYRMLRMVRTSTALRRMRITALDVAPVVVGCLIINWAVLTAWTVVDPMTWVREDVGTDVDGDGGILTQESVGYCASENTGAWVGSLFSFHLTIMIATNVMLWKLRGVNDRYQESKYITLASLFACEFLLLGIPILVAVGESSEARHIVLVCIIGFTDLGVLLMVFVPKIRFQKKGLPEGISPAKSILKASIMSQRSRQSILCVSDGTGRGTTRGAAEVIPEVQFVGQGNQDRYDDEDSFAEQKLEVQDRLQPPVSALSVTSTCLVETSGPELDPCQDSGASTNGATRASEAQNDGD